MSDRSSALSCSLGVICYVLQFQVVRRSVVAFVKRNLKGRAGLLDVKDFLLWLTCVKSTFQDLQSSADFASFSSTRVIEGVRPPLNCY